MRDNSFNTLLRLGKLSQPYCTDLWAKVERARLLWCELNQKTLKVKKYQGLIDASTNNDLPSAGQNIVLAPTITGSPSNILHCSEILIYFAVKMVYREAS